MKKELKCDFCDSGMIDDGLSDEWYEKNGRYCSSECRYESETGNPGEEY